MSVTARKGRKSPAARPAAKSTAGAKQLRSLDEILSPEQRTQLHDELLDMARKRRDAEATSASLRLS